ncbi:RNA-binding protein squid-like isoform X2 [Rhopalosiphum padi]|uniref:RNA-binding protein squid-like isoform X2 n=1 Tax=Rhopalosiphum padi TaxID=40932 RepID=UPI00298DE673|nr:RNA-binding protein squid-like isoform X2 [Rhopalosiphum padi]
MADNQQQNGSQQFENAADAQQQQQHLNGTSENSTTNNDSGQFECVRDDDRKIFVGGLKGETTEKDLSEHFGQFGEIENINVKVDAATGRARGFAFIVYKTMEGLDNALACTNHVINDKKIDPKKAKARHVKLFVGGLSPDLTDDDIKDYFKRYAPLVNAEMPFDKVKNQRKGFCFVTFDCMQAVTEILKTPKHVINGKQVDVKKAALKVEPYGMMPGASGPMRGMRGNVRGRGGRGGYDYYNQYTGYSPDYSYSYGYPSYGAGAGADYQYGGYEPPAPRGVHGNRGGKDFPQRKPVKTSA